MAQTVNNRIELDLNVAINHAIDRTVQMTTSKVFHNVFYVVGAPGGGKTEMLKSAAADRGYGMLAYTPALERVEKFGGIPDIFTSWINQDNEEHDGEITSKNHAKKMNLKHELRTEWSVPQMICEIRDMAKQKPFVIVLLDDWHLCPANIQQIGFELFTHRSLNGHKIPDNVAFILAGNEKSAAGAKIQLSAIRNRCTMLYVQSNVDYWVDEFAIPAGLHPIGISFFSIKENKSIFHEEESTNEQYGSPRSWTAAFNNISNLEIDSKFDPTKSADKKIMRAIIQGCVGTNAAKAFFEYYDIYSKIPVNKIFTGDEKISIPTDPVSRYAYASAVSSKFYNLYIETPHNSKDGKDRVNKYCGIFGEIMSEVYSKYPEISVRCLKYIADRKADVENKIPGGPEIIAKMALQQHIPIEFLKKLDATSRLLNSAKSK